MQVLIINTSDNTLILTDKTGIDTTFTITSGNYTVSSFMNALDERFLVLLYQSKASLSHIVTLQTCTLFSQTVTFSTYFKY